MSDDETRERLLKAAERLFGDRGFKRATVREICVAARANVAAVNYYFGDKLGLYGDVMQRAIAVMQATTAAAREAGAGQPAEEQLRRFVGIFVRRLLTPGHETVHRLIHRELHDPTPALDAIVEQAIRPRVEYLSGVVAAMMGCAASDEVVLRAVASIQAQVIAYLPNPLMPAHRDIAARLGFSFEPTPERIEQAAQHIATFSIAGVSAVAASAASAGGDGEQGEVVHTEARRHGGRTEKKDRTIASRNTVGSGADRRSAPRGSAKAAAANTK